VQTKSRAFTLIELLVTVLIVSILMALLFPALNMALNKARTARCASNMRQIGMAFQLYLQNNDNVLPQRFYPSASPRAGYDELLLPYTGGDTHIFQCSSHQKPDYPYEPSYGMNWYYDNCSAMLVTINTKTILAAETLGSGVIGSHRADRDSKDPGMIDKMRHRGKANYLFFDGHVELLKYEQTLSPEDLWGTDYGRHDEELPESYTPAK
jgi:prepilin-type processing-associated H-X9-DG protein/prepilin-type N-terminal cleavage/methylation domain-containing protein